MQTPACLFPIESHRSHFGNLQGVVFLLTEANPAAIKLARMRNLCSTEQNSILLSHTLVLLLNYVWMDQDIVSCDMQRDERHF
jgi:hypothetical protein